MMMIKVVRAFTFINLSPPGNFVVSVSRIALKVMNKFIRGKPIRI